MIDDRSYMQSSAADSRRPLTIVLIMVLIVLFVVEACLIFYARLPLFDWFALSLDGFKQKHYWQLLTFQFMHTVPWPWHVLFNCLGLYFFGRPVEETLGRKGFLTLYFASGFFGGAVELLTNWILPHHADFQVVGASAGVMGLLAAYATLYPMRELTYFIFLFPITIRAQYLLWLAFGLSAFGVLVPYDATAQAAHLGGLVMGVAFIRWGHKIQAPELAHWRPFQSRRGKLEILKSVTVKPSRFGRQARLEETTEVPSEEFMSKEVDPILEKISAHGIKSLTERERQILQAARARMSK
jgi:membrane associated rhomboid family serine protease